MAESGFGVSVRIVCIRCPASFSDSRLFMLRNIWLFHLSRAFLDPQAIYSGEDVTFV